MIFLEAFISLLLSLTCRTLLCRRIGLIVLRRNARTYSIATSDDAPHDGASALRTGGHRSRVQGDSRSAIATHSCLGEHLIERLDATAAVIVIPKAFLIPNIGLTLHHSPMCTTGGYSWYEAGVHGGRKRFSRHDRMSTPVEDFRQPLHCHHRRGGGDSLYANVMGTGGLTWSRPTVQAVSSSTARPTRLRRKYFMAWNLSLVEHGSEQVSQ
jgi:hypothetical protein